MSDAPFSPGDFGASFKGFLDQVAQTATESEPELKRRIREHFGSAPDALPVVMEQFEPSDHPNVHLALEAYLAEPGRSSQLLGIAADNDFTGLNLSHLVAPAKAGFMGGEGPRPGPVRYANVAVGTEQILSCVERGLFLIDGAVKLVALLAGANQFGWRPKLALQVMAKSREEADAFLSDIRNRIRARNVYRGKTLTLHQNKETGALEIEFKPVPPVRRDQLVLSPGVLERIERTTIRFAQHAERLRASGRHLKRGLLLHGPPGTGKTMTAMYLSTQMSDRTTLLLTGGTLGMLERACGLARALAPSMVVLEDVDLIAEERERQRGSCSVPLLFELLNQMDGIAADADVLFVLTTNRPDILEPALASRPGRIDQAVEIGLPDGECRRRLFDLYGAGLELARSVVDTFVDRTNGASAAFIRELIRRAALIAADQNPASPRIAVAHEHLDSALHELLVLGGPLTQALLGARVTPASA